jgi:hypothetical protein
MSSIDPAVLAETTILFVGDNGTPRQVTPRSVRGAKSSLYEGGVNVPCIISGPAVSGQLNRTNDSQVQFVDFFKTMLEMQGLDARLHTPTGAATDSVSFAGHLTDQNLASTHDCQFSIRFSDPISGQDGSTIANDSFKFIRFSDGDEEFYNRSDEFNNLLDAGLNGIQSQNYLDLIEKMAVLVDPPKVNSVGRDNGSIIRPDLFNEFEVVFNQDVDVSAANLSIRNDSTMQPLDLAGGGFSYDSDTFTATWDLGALPSPVDAAFYTFEVVSADVTSSDDDTALDGDGDGVSGPNRQEAFLVAIPGDANLDGMVNVLNDAVILIANLNLSGNTSWGQGDFNADGAVDVLGDAFILIGNLGRTLVQ